MWFLGLILGLFIGGAIHGFEGASLGALIGWAVGYGLAQLIRGQDQRAREQSLETRFGRIETRLQALEKRLQEQTAPEASLAAPTPPAEASDSGPIAPASGAAVAPALTAAAPPTPAATEVAASPGPQEPATSAPSAPPAAPARPGAPRSPAPPARRPAAKPSWAWSWLMGGNTVVRVGVIVLFFGLAFLLKYAYEHTYIPIALRLTGVALGAIAMLVIGWGQRSARPGYALALQGGGVGVLYLTVFSALKLYHLIPPEAAFAVLLAVAALSAALAVMQDAQSLAALGAAGGFLAPILASTGSGDHVMLFSYYTVLNLGILGVAWYRAWRPLNVLGFAFTFSIGTLWGARFYRPELFASTEPFLIIFFVLYLTIPILFAHRRARPLLTLEPGAVRSYVDGTLVFGTPLIAFGLQTRLVHDFEYGSAWSAAALGAIYLALARVLYARRRDELRLLIEAFLALGVVFATLALPLALDGRWTSAAWALEGGAILWAGIRQQRRPARAFGILLQFAAGFSFALTFDRDYGAYAIFNSFYLGCVFVAVAALFSSWYLDRHRARLGALESAAAAALFLWGLAWWTGAGIQEIHRWVPMGYRSHAWVLFAAGSCLALSLLSGALDWRFGRIAAPALMPLMLLGLAADIADQSHPLANLGWLGWPVGLAAHLLVLRRHDQAEHAYFRFLHACQLWLVAGLASWELAWHIDQAVAGSPVWGSIARAVVPGGLLALLALRAQQLPWPVRGNVATYLTLGAGPLAFLLWAWIFVANFSSDGNASPLPYVPLINPLDTAQAAALLAVFVWLRGLKVCGLADYFADSPELTYGALGTAAFVGLNGTLLRTLHHWAGVPFSLHAMLTSMLVQASLSIFWTALALCAMVIATRSRLRALWMLGAALMGVVVGKLFLVDLSNAGSVERIVSFTGVGVLMLVIGYFSPVPPRHAEQSK